MATVQDCDTETEVKCTFCKGESPTLHCNTCRITLCAGCVGDHTTSQLTIQHNIAAYELRDTSIKHPACTSHVNFSCELHCEDCSVSVCSQCCTETHQSHEVTDITKLYIKQGNIKRDIEISEKLILPEYENIISDIRNQISILQNEYQKLRESVSKQGEIWHEEINNVISIYQKKIQEMEMNDLSILQRHLSETENKLSLYKEITQKNRDTLNSKIGNNLLKYSSNNKEMRQIPAMCQISPPTFKSLAVTHESLYQQFGNITTSTKSFTEGYTIKIPPGTPEEVTTIDTGYEDLWRVSCKSTEQVWITQLSCREIRCIDLHGSLQQTVTNESGRLYGLTVNKQGHLVYTVERWRSGAVYQVIQGKKKAIITLQGWIPTGVCSTSDGDLLVFMTDTKTSKVVRYCGSTVKQEIMYDDKGQLLYGIGDLFITESTNKDVWVSDHTARAVVVSNQSGKFKFRYTGNLESNNYEAFCPWCIDSDSQGHVLVIDRFNNCVHIIDEKGHLLCYIDNMSDPEGLSVDNNDHVWISEDNGKVKVIKYLKC